MTDEPSLFENILRYSSITPVNDSKIDMQPDISFSSPNHEIFHDSLLSILNSNSDKSKSIIFSTNRIINGKRRATGGFADRFKGLASAILWSIGAERSFKLDWTHPFNLDQIYDFPFAQVENKGEFRTLDLIDKNRIENLPIISEKGILSFTPEDDNIIFHSNNPMIELLKINDIREKFPNVDFDQEGQPGQIGNKELMSSILSIFKLLPDEKEANFLSSFIKLKQDFQTTVGLQFRTGGDGEWRDPDWGDPKDISRLIEEIDKKLPQNDGKSLLYLATDSNKAKEIILELNHSRFRLLCSNGPIAHMDRSSGDMAIQGSRFAIIENHLLSHCDKIYTVHGGFAKLAGDRANMPITRINLKKIESPSQKTLINVKEKTLLRNNLMSEKLFSEENKFLYIGVPKAATRSILSILRRDTFATSEFNEPISFHLDKNPSHKNLFIFSFVRNPWSRVVSTWKNKVANSNEGASRVIIDRFEELYHNMPFEEFVSFVCNSESGNDLLGDRHWTSQNLFLKDTDGNLVPDFIGRLENLEEDFSHVLTRIGIDDISLPWLNTRRGWKSDSKTMKKDSQYYYREFYSPDLESMVSERYKDDISYFNYEF